MGGSDSVDSPKTDYRGDILKFTRGVRDALPKVLNAEGKYRNDFSGLNLDDISNFLGGTKGSEGLFGQLRGANNKAEGLISDSRRNDIKGMTGQTGITRSFLDALSPESAAQIKGATEQAALARQNAQGLTGQEARDASQFARESSADRGRVMDNSSIFAEGLNRDSILTGKRQEAAQMTNSAYNMANSFYSTPGIGMLNSPSQSYQAGQGLLGIGLSSIGQSKPQLIDIGAGLNLGAADRANQLGAAAANAQMPSKGAQAAAGAATGATIGTAVYPGIGTAVGAVIGGAGGYLASDERLKTNKKKVGETDDGLPIYTYKYLGSDTSQMGVMAQDAKKKNPKAVAKLPSGFLGVDYDKIK